MTTNNKLDVTQTGTFCRSFGRVAEHIVAGLIALEIDRMSIADKEPSSSLPHAIDLFKSGIEQNSLTALPLLFDAVDAGKRSQQSIDTKEKQTDAIHEALSVSSDPLYLYNVGYYADVALKVYEAAKGVAQSPTAKALEQHECATFCREMEENRDTLDHLCYLAGKHADIRSKIPTGQKVRPLVKSFEMPKEQTFGHFVRHVFARTFGSPT